MALLLDTATLPPAERDDALTELHSSTSTRMRISHDLPNELIRNVTHFWNIGSHNGLVRSIDTNMRISRGASDLRSGGDDLFAVSFQHSGMGAYLSGDSIELQSRGDIHLENCARPREYAYRGAGDNASFLMSHGDLDLPIAVVTDAATRLPSSPLYRMAQAHFARLSDVVEQIQEHSEASELLASATVQLTRALVASTVPESSRARDAMHETLLTAILFYLRQHLGDASLSPQLIAASHHISVRQLYKVWSGVGESLNDWIIRERLDGARKELASPLSILVTIEVIARRWGFSDASHFSRRFREAYGFTPREWRMSGAASNGER